MSNEFDLKYNIDNYNPEKEIAEWNASFIVDAWESRFPDILTDDMRYLLWHFIKDCFDAELNKK